jgi:hypothetical protein
MQQQLCDQFQQTTLMMFRMFTTMHQEQASLIREEMQQIQRVTAELYALQRQVQDKGVPERQARPLRETLPRSTVPPRPVTPLATLPDAKAVDHGADTAVPLTAPSGLPTSDPAPLPPASPVEMDSWLNQRINELQAERQTRWQRVLSFLSGQ